MQGNKLHRSKEISCLSYFYTSYLIYFLHSVLGLLKAFRVCEVIPIAQPDIFKFAKDTYTQTHICRDTQTHFPDSAVAD